MINSGGIKPYTSPIIGRFMTRPFLTKSREEISRLRRLRIEGISITKRNQWFQFAAHGRKHKKRANGSNHWHHKLYICVTPRAYWLTVRRLVSQTKTARLTWKLWTHLRSYSRPDKIVLYCNDGIDLKRKTALVRRILGYGNSHLLGHACLASCHKLEKSGKGLYVGMDPSFLKTSWRYYRCIVGAHLAINKEYYRKRTPELIEFLKTLNVSLEHEGPRSLNPSKKYIPTIRRVWNAITKE